MIIEIIDEVVGWQTFIYRGYRHVNTCSLCRYVTTILEHGFCLNRSTTDIFTKQRIKTFFPNIFSLKETYCIQIYPVSEGYLRKILFERTNTTLYGIPKDKYPSDGGKVEKKLRIGKKIPLLSTNQKTAFIYKVELLLLLPFNGHHQLVDCSAIGVHM